LITNEINRILRDMNKEPGDENKEEDRMVWRRENDIRSELERARQDLALAAERAHEAEKRCMTFEQRVKLAEERYLDVIDKRETADNSISSETAVVEPAPSSRSLGSDDDRIWESTGRTSHSALMAHILSGGLIF
jgi:hypothetical protein